MGEELGKRPPLLPPKDPVALGSSAHGGQPSAERADPARRRDLPRHEHPPILDGAKAHAAIRVQHGEAHALDRLPVGFQLGVGSTAGGRETDDRLGRGFHFEREGELSAERDQVETQGSGCPNDEERLLDEPLERGAFGRGQRPSVAAHGVRLSLEQATELPFVGGGAVSDHGRRFCRWDNISRSEDSRRKVAASVGLEILASDLPVARVLAGLVADSDRRRTVRGLAAQPARFRLSELRTKLLRERVFEDPSRLLTRLKRRGLLLELPEGKGEKLYQIPYPEELRQLLLDEVVRSEAIETSALGPVPDERAEIRAMDGEFLDRLREVLRDRLDSTVEFGRTFNVQKLAGYLKGLFGEELYFDSLISLLQQYALADTPLLAPTGRPTGSTGFHLALFGPPGTGKTFSIDDLIRGNPRSGVPAHGLPGRNRYCGGITPVQFLRVGAAYTGRTFNFIVPEFNDWFKYRGMVEPLKLVMEQREVKWETTFGTVGPYTFRSFFSVNYNVRTAGAQDYWTTIADPNFAALEDRMLLRFHPMTRARFRAVEASSERLELGEIDFALAEKIRDHLTLVYAIETGHPLVAGKFRARPVRLERSLYEKLREVSERALKTTDFPKFSPRLKSRAVRLAAAASLLTYFAPSPQETVKIGSEESEFARRFYEEEIRAREGRHGRTAG